MSDEEKFREAQEVIKKAVFSLAQTRTPHELTWPLTTVLVGLYCSFVLKNKPSVYVDVDKGCTTRIAHDVESFIVSELQKLENKIQSRN